MPALPLLGLCGDDNPGRALLIAFRALVEVLALVGYMPP